MRFTSTLFLAFSALASLVSAQSTITSSSGPATTSSAISGNTNPISSPLGGTLKAGALTTITWTPTSGTSVTLVLREGKENNLAEIVTIACEFTRQFSGLSDFRD
ncbi:hypothetical protein Q9L58_000559 [Maublancomyces gigas]|uniref:Yeast cell wall synthesis Kre9/Knh1-like N-terminal domain-containing protein n=1 Tax=Discina gigas TaxID=1032678 RepID=A0ABR3GWG0_9PEZI